MNYDRVILPKTMLGITQNETTTETYADNKNNGIIDMGRNNNSDNNNNNGPPGGQWGVEKSVSYFASFVVQG